MTDPGNTENPSNESISGEQLKVEEKRLSELATQISSLLISVWNQNKDRFNVAKAIKTGTDATLFKSDQIYVELSEMSKAGKPVFLVDDLQGINGIEFVNFQYDEGAYKSLSLGILFDNRFTRNLEEVGESGASEELIPESVETEYRFLDDGSINKRIMFPVVIDDEPSYAFDDSSIESYYEIRTVGMTLQRIRDKLKVATETPQTSKGD